MIKKAAVLIVLFFSLFSTYNHSYVAEKGMPILSSSDVPGFFLGNCTKEGWCKFLMVTNYGNVYWKEENNVEKIGDGKKYWTFGYAENRNILFIKKNLLVKIQLKGFNKVVAPSNVKKMAKMVSDKI